MARAVGVLLGLFILAGGVIATVYAGFRLLYVLSILIGLAVIFGRPLAILRISTGLRRGAANMGMVIEYRFGPDGFTYSSSDEGGTVGYGEVTRLFETRDYYFVYVALKMAHILRKSDFVQGDPAAFGAFLTARTGKPCVRRDY